MENVGNICLKQEDFLKISSMLLAAPEEIRDLLQGELDRASVLTDDILPEGLVAMHSNVEYLDLESGQKTEIKLVYPNEASLAEHKISIFAPVGAALIGLKVGQRIAWPLPNGREKKIEVVRVT
ncbi:MAG: nucleoside diphosphate kinase regulator [Sphingobacteriales bacterium]|nr:MAG: nucleoside diphosphate kinase regulator [Sphingobacteriales bacterium]